MNDLDRAIVAVRRSKAGLPDFYRELSRNDLWFLVPFHPEVAGESLELKNGSPLPFARLEDGPDGIVPLFSSEARLDEGLKNGHVPGRTYSAASMPAIQVLEILGKAGLRAIVNKSCATGEVKIPPNLMSDLAAGKVLAAAEGPKPPTERGRVRILDPADYPTHLIQPAFEFMRSHRNFRAAWIFAFPSTDQSQAATTHRWQMLILMQPRDAQLAHELNLTVQAARSQTDDVGIGQVDENNAAYIQNLFQKAAAFYIAADYARPSGPGTP